MYIKNLLKTTAAVATLIAGSQSWGSSIDIASFKNDGSLGTKHAVHGAFVAGTMPAVAVPDKAVIALTGTAVTGTSGGIVALGKELYFDIAADWTIMDLVATENLDVFLRPSTAGTATTFEFTNVILAGKAQTVKFWGDSGISLTAPAVGKIKREARYDRDADAISTVDLPASVPTKIIGGRTYTLKSHYSSQ